MRPKLTVLLVGALMLLAAACSGEVHDNVSDALAGRPGDTVEIEAVEISDPAYRISRGTARSMLRFEACDAAGDCMHFEVGATTGDSDAQPRGVEALDAGDFVEIRSGEIVQEEGFQVVRAGIASPTQRPADWPDS